MRQHQLILLIALVSANLTCPTPTGAEIMMSTGVRYDAFRNNQSPRVNGHELTLRFLADVRYYGASDQRVDSGLPLDGKRVRYAIGPGLQSVVNKHLTCDGLLKLDRMRQETDSETPQAVTFQGLNLDVGVTYTF